MEPSDSRLAPYGGTVLVFESSLIVTDRLNYLPGSASAENLSHSLALSQLLAGPDKSMTTGGLKTVFAGPSGGG
jgi:hypothetical protein